MWHDRHSYQLTTWDTFDIDRDARPLSNGTRQLFCADVQPVVLVLNHAPDRQRADA
jgi:hypothetical protein